MSSWPVVTAENSKPAAAIVTDISTKVKPRCLPAGLRLRFMEISLRVGEVEFVDPVD